LDAVQGALAGGPGGPPGKGRGGATRGVLVWWAGWYGGPLVGGPPLLVVGG